MQNAAFSSILSVKISYSFFGVRTGVNFVEKAGESFFFGELSNDQDRFWCPGDDDEI
jgi:hypothetical protein